MRRYNVSLLILILLLFIPSIVIIGCTKKDAEKSAKKMAKLTLASIRKYKNRTGNLDETISQLKDYLSVHKDSAKAWFELAECYFSKDDILRAEKSVKEGLKLEPDNSWGIRLYARVYRYKGSLDKALEVMKKALALNANDVGVNAEMAEIYIAKKEKEKAMEYIKKCLQKEPRNSYFNEIKQRIERIETAPQTSIQENRDTM